MTSDARGRCTTCGWLQPTDAELDATPWEYGAHVCWSEGDAECLSQREETFLRMQAICVGEL